MSRTLQCRCGSAPPLTTLLLAPGLPAMGCRDCGAVLLQMDDWRRWRSASPAEQAPATEQALAHDHAQASACPACGRFMARLPVDAGGAFRVDRCVPCQLVWLDRGEWQALTERGLARQLDVLLSDAGQRRIQADRLQAARLQTLRQRHGDDCIDEVLRIRAWLAGQAQPGEILALLRAADLAQP